MTVEDLIPFAAVLAAAVTVAGSIIVAKLNQTGQRAAADQQAHAASVEAAAREWQKLYQGQAERLDAMQHQVDELREWLRAQEIREYQMIRDLTYVYDWIASGMKPPPPKKPDYISLPFDTKPIGRNNVD